MKELKQNYHGLPGMGINGKLGETGKSGNSIYMGFINDFFDGITINVSTYVYIAKKMCDSSSLKEEEQDEMLLNAWDMTLAQLTMYNGSNNLGNYVINSSKNKNKPYFNFETYYYNGNIYSTSTMLPDDPSIKNKISDTSHIGLSQKYLLDIDGDYISMSFMIDSLNNNINKNIHLFKFDSDYSPSHNFIDYKPSLDTKNINLLYKNIDYKLTHYEFNSNAGVLINNGKKTNMDNLIPFNTNDILYYVNPSSGIDAETGVILEKAAENSSYILIYPEIDNVSITYLKEVISHYDEKLIINYSTDSNIFQSSLQHQLLINRTDSIFLNSKFINKWDTYYKKSIKFNANDPNYKTIYKKGDLKDAEGNSFYGIPPRVVLNRSSNLNNLTTITDKNKIFDKILYKLEDINQYKNHMLLMLTTNDSHIFYSFNDDDTTIFVPTHLKNIYKSGDILYFYTDKNDFYNTYKINYMVLLNDDLLNCQISDLIDNANLIDPLSVKTFSEDVKSRVLSVNKNAVYYNNDQKINPTFNKRMISIIDNYTIASALLCSFKNNIFASLCAIVQNDNYNKILVSLNNDELNNEFILLDTSNNLKVTNNLIVNTDNISDKTNVELSKFVYNQNIKIYENNFIKPIDNIDLYFDNNNEYSSIFILHINGDDYFYDIDNLENYIYGCDIYNKNMEKIKTISSIKNTFDVEIIPETNEDTEYYLQMFAAYGTGLKYFSKLSKLSIEYKDFLYANDINKIILPTGYESSIGKYSIDKEISLDKKYLISSYKIEILGNNQKIIKEKYSNNIVFSVLNITAEKNDDVRISIYPIDNNIEITNILFNNTLYLDSSQFNVNNWCEISKNENSSISEWEYSLNTSSNLPVLIYLQNEKISYLKSDYISQYITGGSSDSSSDLSSESLLFTKLKDDNNYFKTNQRSLLITAQYKFKDSDEFYYENYNLILPGFEDTRDIPTIKLNTHTDNLIELESYNLIENGTLTNQFVTYLDIDITDFKSKWGKFANDSSISMDLTISSLDYNLEWQKKYVVKDLINYANLKVLSEPFTNENLIFNNYVKLDTSLISSTLKNVNINTSIYLINESYKDKLDALIIDSSNDNSKYVLFDSSFNNIMKIDRIYAGLYNSIDINVSDIQILNDSDKIRLKILFEFGNPVVSKIYYRFYVKNIIININDNKCFYTYVPRYSNESSESIESTYLFTSVGSNIYTDVKYKYISLPINVNINPLSYTICPLNIESTYTNIYGDIYKYGIKDQIIKNMSFFNTSVYKDSSINYNDVRDNYIWDFSDLNIKKSYVLDNIKNIYVYPVSLYDTINTSINSKSIIIDELLKTHNVLDFIEGNKYLSIVYHSTIMQPRIRNDKYTFYYNDSEYEREKYDLLLNNLPIFAYDSLSINLRDNDLLDSMDELNNWFAENKQTLLINDSLLYTGILNLYGNGYTQIPTDTNVVLNTPLTLYDVSSANNENIVLYENYDEVNINLSKENDPNTGNYYRGFLYDIKWEFPYYNKESIIPYRIVSPFDNLLNNISSSTNILSNNASIYEEYYKALIDSSLYNNRMIPYNLLFNLEPRITCNYDNNSINVLMLRRPSIGIDTDNISKDDFKEKYEFNRRLFNISSDISLKYPYTIK